MAAPEVCGTLPSFRMWPKKTFFGLDKNAAFCFTLHKDLTDGFIRHFGLREGRLQSEVTFIIRDKEYPATVRWARMDRRNPTKLAKEDLPERDTVQFGWQRFELTQHAMRDNLREAFDLISSGQKNNKQSVMFHHAGDGTFLIQFE